MYIIRDVILLALKEDDTTGSCYLYRLFYMVSVIIISDYMCTKVCLCITATCKDGA